MVFLSGLANISAQSPTTVHGIIATDTTWTKADGPYAFIGTLSILSGVTLTIEPGVTVDFAGNHMQVNGTINVHGTSTEPVQFSSNGGDAITFNGDTASDSIIENANLNSADITIDGSSPTISNSKLNCRISIYGGAPQIINNKFITGDGLVLYDSNAVIAKNTFSHTNQAIYVGSNQFYSSPLIVGNLITDNGYGILIPCSVTFNPIIKNNTIANNTVGIGIWNGSVPLPTISYNNIYGNHGYNFRLTDIHVDVNAAYNWWGTTDEVTIETSIIDFKKDSRLGNIIYQPILTEYNQQATPDTMSLSDFTDRLHTTPKPTTTSSPIPTPDYSNSFNIESNSTVTAFAFNSSIPEISFTVSGTTGTDGYVKATLSKNFMPTTNNIKVYLDGVQTDYTIESNGNSWIVMFTYHHSSHHVAISAVDFASVLQFPSWAWQVAAVGLAASFVAAVISIGWMKRKTLPMIRTCVFCLMATTIESRQHIKQTTSLIMPG